MFSLRTDSYCSPISSDSLFSLWFRGLATASSGVISLLFFWECWWSFSSVICRNVDVGFILEFLGLFFSSSNRIVIDGLEISFFTFQFPDSVLGFIQSIVDCVESGLSGSECFTSGLPLFSAVSKVKLVLSNIICLFNIWQLLFSLSVSLSSSLKLGYNCIVVLPGNEFLSLSSVHVIQTLCEKNRGQCILGGSFCSSQIFSFTLSSSKFTLQISGIIIIGFCSCNQTFKSGNFI